MASLKVAALQRNVLIALARFLMQDRPGGVMGPAIEMLVKVLRGRGAIAYKFEDDKLEMVSEAGLPRRAKAWLAHLRLNEEAWFIAQSVAVSQRVEIDETLAASRQGVSIRPALEEAGWQALAATPVRVGRRLYGVIVVASDNPYAFDKDTLMLLESVGGIVGLAMERDKAVKAAKDTGLPDHRTAQLVTQGLIAQSVARDLQDPVESMATLTESQEHVINHLRRQGAAPDLVDHLELAIQDTWEALRRVQSVSARLLVLAQESDREQLNLTEMLRAATESLATELEQRGITLELYGDDLDLYIDGRIDALQMTFVQLLVYTADKCTDAGQESAVMAVRLGTKGDTHEVTIESSASASGESQFNTLIGRSGSGNLGIELARETVRSHDGHVELGRSSLGGGSITIVLPAAQTTAPVFDKSESLPAMPAFQNEKPLIVWIDDDADFVRVMCRQFESHDALVAGSIDEARNLIDNLPILPELILCDVNLPDGLGIRLHAEASPELGERFVFMTGGVIAEEVANYLKTSRRPTLIKPVRFEEVARLLANEGGGPNISRTLRRDDPPAEASYDIEDEESFDGYPDEIGMISDPAPNTDRRGGMGDREDFRGTMPGYQGSPSEPPMTLDLDDDDAFERDRDDPGRHEVELDLDFDRALSGSPSQRRHGEPSSLGFDSLGFEEPEKSNIGSVAPGDFEDIDDGWDI